MRILLIATICICGCARSTTQTAATPAPPPTSAPSAVAPDAGQIARDYTGLKSMLPHPAQVDAALAVACAPPETMIARAQKQHGPHAFCSVNIYMNEVAATAFKQSAFPYPVNSVIVKEKWAAADSPNHVHPQGSNVPDGVGGMIKRTAGYDPDHGDWEYFYVENRASIQNGRIASCVQCHQAASKTDHVFGAWGSNLPANERPVRPDASTTITSEGETSFPRRSEETDREYAPDLQNLPK